MEILIKAKSKTQFIRLQELVEFRDLFYILSWRDIKVRYKQTVIGVLWVLLQPLISTFIFTVFFGTFVEIPSDNLPYPIFVLIGLIYWGLFSQALSRAAGSLVENQQLVKKVYFPRELLPFSAVLTAFADFLVSLVLLLIALIYYGIVPNLLFVSLAVLSAFITMIASSGLGMLLAAINVSYRDVRYIIPFFLQLLIFVSPVIYPLAIVRPSFQMFLAINPMSGLIDALRSTLSSQTIEHPLLLLISIISSFIFFVGGALYFKNHERKFADIL